MTPGSGTKAAKNLRNRVLERYAMGRGLDCYHEDLKNDFWAKEGGDDDDDDSFFAFPV